MVPRHCLVTNLIEDIVYSSSILGYIFRVLAACYREPQMDTKGRLSKKQGMGTKSWLYSFIDLGASAFSR
jgi:hypothetical protein